MTATATQPAIGKDIQKLRQLVIEHEKAAEKVRRLEGEIYTLTADLVHNLVALQKVKRNEDAVALIADTVKRSTHTVARWFSLGQFMQTHGLPKDVNTYNVRLAYNGFQQLRKSDQFKALNMVKDPETAPKQMHAFMNAKRKTDTEVLRRVRKLEKDNRLTRKELRMQMMALATLAKRVLHRDKVYVCITDEDYVPLEEFGGK